MNIKAGKINYLQHAKDSLGIAFVVGIILTLLNHFKVIIELSFTIETASGWIINFLVPFAVSFYSRVMADKKLSEKLNDLKM